MEGEGEGAGLPGCVRSNGVIGWQAGKQVFSHIAIAITISLAPLDHALTRILASNYC